MIGCLVPVLLLLVGGRVGGLVAGENGRIWGGSIGFLIGIAAFVVLIGLLARARHR
jgi:hypothetical protein